MPLGAGEIVLPPGRGLFLNAAHASQLVPALQSRLICEQPLRPSFERLLNSGWDVHPLLEPGAPSFALVLLGKHADENRINLARAYRALPVGGLLVLFGSNEVGAARWERHVLPWLQAPETRFKHKSRVSWGVKPAKAEPGEVATWIALDGPRPILEGAYTSFAGLFGWDKIDRGSALLVDCLPAGLEGAIADLGGGWGFLSDQVLRRFAGIQRLDFIEADARGIEAARQNLGRLEQRAELRFHWHDATTGLPDTYDWILCNPPFHEGRETRPELGLTILKAGIAALRGNGTLLAVANRHLPYEEGLAPLAEVERIADREGFKVLRISRRSIAGR